MALEGTLRDFSLADILQLIGIQKKTGVLSLKDDDQEVRVSFHQGMIVNAELESEQTESRLGNVLVRKGVITQEQLNRALEIQGQSLQRLGQVLLENGFINQADLREALRNQVLQIVYGLFRWKNGHYHFSPQAMVDYDADNFEPISTESILMEGLRMLDEWPLIERAIPHGGVVFRRTAKADQVQNTLSSSLDESLLTGEEDKVRLPHEQEYTLSLIDGLLSVDAIADRSKLLEFETYRALYDLMDAGYIEKTEYTAPVFSEYRQFATKRTEIGVPMAIAIGIVFLLAFLFSLNSPYRNVFPSYAGVRPGSDVDRMLEMKRLEGVKARALRRMVSSGFTIQPSNLITVGDSMYMLPGKYGLGVPISFFTRPIPTAESESDADQSSDR